MCWVVNIMCWVSKRLLGRHHHVLGQPRLLGRPRSLARHSLPSRAPLLTRHPPRRPVILRRVGNLSRASLPSRQPAGPGRDGPVTLWRRPVPWSRAVRSGVLHPSKIGHVVLPSCFVDRQRTTLHTSRNKRTLYVKCDVEKRPLLRPTDKRGKQPSNDFVSCFENAWEGHWYSAYQIHIRTRARRKSKWTTGGYGALRRCGCSQSGKRTQFHCLKFRLGSAGEPTICSHCYDVLNEDGCNYISMLELKLNHVSKWGPRQKEMS